jgi:hypothetical protein
MKRSFLFLFSALILFSSCGIFKKVDTTDNFLPPEFEELEFGMSPTEVSELRPSIKFMDQNFDFRAVYLEENPATTIKSAIYYFDADGNKPFYELIIEYPDIASRDAAAEALFGKPNMGGEWYFEDKGPYPIKAWVFKEKLVVAALIPQTEWWEDAQKGVDDWR